MAQATIQRFIISVTGLFAAMHWMHPATRIIDGATTVSFTAGVDEHTVTDSAGGFAGAAVGDQIEFTGSSNDAVNGFFRVKAKASDNQVTLEKRGFGAKTNGATVAAGDPIIVSQVPQNTKATLGTINLSNGATVKVGLANFEQENHEVWGHVSGKLSTPLTKGQVVTATVAQDAAWVCGNGDGNAALAAVAVANFSDLIDSSLEYDFDNSFVCINGVGDAPSGVGAAVDPATDLNITEWWAPDLLALADGADFASVPGQIDAGSTLVPRKGAAWTWKFKESGIGGNGCIETTDWGTDCWRQSITGAGTFVTDGPKTVITITWRKDFSATNYRRISANDTWPNIIKNHSIDTNTGAVVSVISVDGAGNGSAWTNYTKEELVAFGAGQVRISNTNNYFESQTSRTYEIAGLVGVDITEAKLKQYIRYCLEFANARWSPEFYVSQSGNDANIGSKASPLLTAQAGIDRTYQGLGGHFVVPEDETVDLRVGFGGQHKPTVAHSHMDWMGIRCDRSSSVAFPQFFNMGDGLGEQEMIKITAAGEGSYCKHWFNLGHDPREPRKIPTLSVHRRAGDAAFEGTYTAQNKMYTVLGDDTAPDETEFIAFFGWCNTVGGGISNVNNGTRETQRRWYVEDYKCSSVHGHGGGHTNPSYHNHAGVVITDQLAMPSPGHEPVNSIEIDDTKSHGHYHDGSRVGVRIFAGQDINDASSHAAQARTGAYFVDCIFSGNPIAVFVAAGQSILEDCVFYDGRDITAWGSRGFGYESKSSMDTLIRPLFIGGDYPNGYSIWCDHSNDIYSQDPTAGPKEYGEGRHFGSAWRGIDIQNGLFYNRPGIAVELTGSENINITNCLFKASGLPLKFNHTTGELTASNFSMDGNVFDIDDSTLAQVGGAAKTLVETEALAGTASGNTEESIVFVDPTRNPDTYAQMYLNDPAADSLELVNEACRQRGLGIYDPELEASFINDWIRTGFYSTSHPGKGPALTGPLQLMATTPVDGSTGVATDASIELVFSAPITLGSGTIRLYNSATDALVASQAAANLTIAGSTLTWATPATLIEGVGYYILTDAGLVNDGAGNNAAAITDPTAMNFTAETHMEIGISNAGSSLADTDSIQLGNTIAIDQSTTVSLTIANAGSEPVTIGTITATGHVSIDATIDPSGTVLAVGENATLGLVVDTSASGAVAGGVSVPSGDAASPFDLSFTGTVVVAQTTGSGTHDVRQAYLDVAEADAILDEVMMGVQLLKQAWDSLQPADKIKCIANASDDFDALVWDGMPSSSSQVTAWPRRYWNGEAMLLDGDPIVPDAVGAGEWSFAGLPREIRIGVAIQSAWKATLALSLAEDRGDPARPLSMLHSHAQKAASPYRVRFVGAV